MSKIYTKSIDGIRYVWEHGTHYIDAIDMSTGMVIALQSFHWEVSRPKLSVKEFNARCKQMSEDIKRYDIYGTYSVR